MRPIHVAFGFAVVAGFAGLMLFGLVSWIARREPGRAFWALVTAVQVAVLVQSVGGVILLLMGRGRELLHYVYGAVFPALLLITAHVLGREMFARRPWVPFAWAGFFCFGLTLRALQTGFAA